MTIYKHKHHIIPKHMGGSDDPSNLVELTIEEHAEAHFNLYKKYGHQEDYLAWKGLSGQIGKEEIVSKIYTENGKRCGKLNKGKEPWNKGKTGIYSSETISQMKESALQRDNTNIGKYERTPEIRKKNGYKKTKEHREKLKKSITGRKWWTNGIDNKQCFDCPGEEWYRGRTKR